MRKVRHCVLSNACAVCFAVIVCVRCTVLLAIFADFYEHMKEMVENIIKVFESDQLRWIR